MPTRSCSRSCWTSSRRVASTRRLHARRGGRGLRGASSPPTARPTHAVGVSSGTEALALALRALGIGPGDEVIVPANSFIATAEAVSLAGATPRLVDVDPETHLLTAEIVEPRSGRGHACVIPVHLYGRTVDMDPIAGARARARASCVIEDACQAHGARYRGRRVGTLGDVGCFCFYPTKNLGAWGDGGARRDRTTRELAERVAPAALARRERRATTTASSARPRGSTRSRPRSCGSSCARLDERQRRPPPRRRDAARRAWRDSARASSRAARAGRTTTCTTCSSCATDAATTLRDAPRAAAASPAPSTTRSRSTAPRRTRASASAPGSLPVAERLAERICSLPIFPDDDRRADRGRLDAVGVPAVTRAQCAPTSAVEAPDGGTPRCARRDLDLRTAVTARQVAAPRAELTVPRRPTRCWHRRCALVLLCCCRCSPLIAIAIRLDSPGPALFRQRRVGRGIEAVHDEQVPHDDSRRRTARRTASTCAR